mmetsp:Transcript_20121/g.33224  ORF Transcript_20121/g.33224 Transcript_20121/m.33224 type:complete len:93 (-) Transcript_20121:623-901(-)
MKGREILEFPWSVGLSRIQDPVTTNLCFVCFELAFFAWTDAGALRDKKQRRIHQLNTTEFRSGPRIQENTGDQVWVTHKQSTAQRVSSNVAL